VARDKKGARKRAATIVFVDESGFTQRPSVRRTWAPKGQTPIIRHHFNWKRLNAIGAIACRPDGTEARMLLHLQEESVVSESIVSYLDLLKQQIAGPVMLLWDGLPAHRSKVVREHIEQQREWLTVERLPAYAPELNPVEYFWSAVKGKDVANFCAHTIGQIKDELQRARERIEQDDIVDGFLRASRLFGTDTLATGLPESH
jgi:transposase